ncbi:hypothetical protein [Rhodoferax saidenbachensis]|uniref:Uncharacterized protein n=2 Tax=Rhodoferax saidenbachensis TaxID=1484693 RepID=A0A1P8KAV9_9BURK|nr:hypothetical protein [Rhodoferax saidenbachensis]APW43122.1 hypothetical protein RS694_11685 [Rhodoferax saidenbachensis]
MSERHCSKWLCSVVIGAVFLIFASAIKSAEAASVTVPFISTTGSGCKFVNRRLGSTEAAQEDHLKSLYDEVMKRFSYEWSGKCEGNFISGTGHLTEILDGNPASLHWKKVEPGKLDRAYFRYAIPSGDIRYVVTSDSYDEDPRTLAECLGIPSCRALHDERIAFVGAEQVAIEDLAAEKSVILVKQAKAANEAHRLALSQRLEQIEKDIEQKNREEKQRILAEKRQAHAADGSDNPLAVVGAVLQGAAAAGAKNAAQLQALGSVLQGNAPSGAGVGGGSGRVDGNGLSAQGEQIDQFNYQETVNECVKFSVSAKAERYYASNTCGYAINLFRCTVGGRIGGECGTESQFWDSTNIRAQANPGQHGYFEPGPSGAYAGGRFIFVACRDPYFPNVKAWNERGFDVVQCRAYKAPR